MRAWLAQQEQTQLRQVIRELEKELEQSEAVRLQMGLKADEAMATEIQRDGASGKTVANWPCGFTGLVSAGCVMS